MMFSDKSKIADAEWKIEMFKQGKKHIANFIIKFEVLAIKAKTDELHVMFLLKKNIQTNIIKTILGHLLIAVLETLKEWKMAITSVNQGYKSTERRQDYQTKIRITYGGRDAPIDIRKARDNFDKNRKPKCFNCNIYSVIIQDLKCSSQEITLV